MYVLVYSAMAGAQRSYRYECFQYDTERLAVCLWQLNVLLVLLQLGALRRTSTKQRPVDKIIQKFRYVYSIDE